MKCFIVVLKDAIEIINFRKRFNLDCEICEINNNNKISRYFVYESSFSKFEFSDVNKVVKENKLSGIIVLSNGSNLEKLVRIARTYNYEVFIIKKDKLIIPNNEIAFEVKIKNLDEALYHIVSF
ncbi:MAG: hypothetical protein N2504_02240 [candidate division WOR-3 bacterium]|nr:hypothetical protein [candidate division WOR-3 bacterium]MCX7947393.1 hypothetical protein [candidate division WOR-3 bacterium]MDW8150051.1 hypothetical protein [candidate division WOR-3 bacterium]